MSHDCSSACADLPDDCPVILRYARDANYAAWLKVSDELDASEARVAQLEGALREFLNSKLESTGDVVVAKARLGFALTDREDPNAPETNWNYGDKP